MFSFNNNIFKFKDSTPPSSHGGESSGEENTDVTQVGTNPELEALNVGQEDEEAANTASFGFLSAASPQRSSRIDRQNVVTRCPYPLTKYTRGEIISTFTAMKIRCNLPDSVLFEIMHILNSIRDAEFSQQPALPRSRHGVTR